MLPRMTCSRLWLQGRDALLCRQRGKKIVGGAGNNDKVYASFLKTPTLVKFGHFLKA